jgi:two-component system, NtrC family, sensor kinase
VVSTKMLIRDADGQITGTFGISHDITGRKRAEDALRDSEEKYRVLYESSSDAIMMLAPPEWKFTAGNPAATALYGARDEREFVAAAPWELSPEYQPDGELSSLKAHRMIDTAMERGSHFFEWTHKKLSGDEFFATVLLNRTIYRGQTLLQATVRDITERKRAEEALRKSQEQLRLLLDSTAEAICALDLDGNCTLANPACLRLLGYGNVDVLIGNNMHNLIHHTRPNGKPYPAEECPVLQALQNGKEVHVDDEVLWRADGTSFPAESWAYPVVREGKVVGAVVTLLDVTERKRLEVELRHAQKLEAVGRLAAGIAHEINTPIQFVGDNTRFLQEAFRGVEGLLLKYEEFRRAAGERVEPGLAEELAQAEEQADWAYLKAEVPKALEQTLDGVNRVAQIVRAMKEFSHVNRSGEKVAADLNKALESTLVVARNELKYVAEVETDFGEIPPVVCYLGDLNQVFLNLLINAAHAIGEVVKGTEGKGRIRVRTWQEGEQVVVAVSDTGTGIPAEIQEKIFEPFFTTKEVGKGTGQGLTLARSVVVDRHGGSLTFESGMGKGTTFFVRVPITAAKAEVEEGVT